MEKLLILIGLLLVTSGCFGQDAQEKNFEATETSPGYSSFGKDIDSQNPLSERELSEQYSKMDVKDTISTKFKATVTDVCKAKGCWMKLRLPNNKETMVRFKDYGFFVPMDIEGREVIVSGKAFIEEMSVEDQKHYAQDAGEPESKIVRITEPEKVYGFEADGVLLQEK